jgi:hypothetical protein
VVLGRHPRYSDPHGKNKNEGIPSIKEVMHPEKVEDSKWRILVATINNQCQEDLKFLFFVLEKCQQGLDLNLIELFNNILTCTGQIHVQLIWDGTATKALHGNTISQTT